MRNGEQSVGDDAAQKRYVRAVAKLGAQIRRLGAGDLSGLANDPQSQA